MIEPDDFDFAGMLTFTSGFWLDANYELTHDRSEFFVWIPPHKIEYIERIDRNDEETTTGPDD